MKKDYILGLSEEGFHRVVYEEWGKEGDTNIPLLCVHGLTRNSHDFDPLANFLQFRGLHIFCPDVVGRGDSDWLKNPLHYTYEQYLADMNSMIARTHAHQVDWIGTSMGGLIGLVMASLPKSPIRKLVLNDVGPQISLKGIIRLGKYAGKDPDFHSMEEAKSYFKNIYAGFGNLTEEQWQKLTENGVYEISPGKFVTKLDHGIKAWQAKSKLAWQMLLHPRKALEGTFFDIDMWHLWRNINCPVLVIHGENSDVLSNNTIEKMKEIHPNTDVLKIPDAGHAPLLINTDEHEFIYQWLMKV